MLAGTRVIVALPPAELDDLVAAGEVLIQEGLSVWTLPYARRRTNSRASGRCSDAVPGWVSPTCAPRPKWRTRRPPLPT